MRATAGASNRRMGPIIGASQRCAQPPCFAVRARGMHAQGRTSGMGRRLSVCIVDDSPVQADIARALLEKAGHSAAIFRTSGDALRAIPDRPPDCVLTDLMMPDVDGYELCRRLRGMPELAATKILMMSTKAYPFERKRAFDLGANGYFVKPLHPATFVVDLERLVTDAVTMTFWGVRGRRPVSRHVPP